MHQNTPPLNTHPALGGLLNDEELKPIPGYSLYCINRLGEIKRLLSKKSRYGGYTSLSGGLGMKEPIHPMLKSLIEIDIPNYNSLVRSGIESHQAEQIVFNRLKVTNENDQMEIRQNNELSECCMCEVGYSGLHTYCTECGESCMVVYPS